MFNLMKEEGSIISVKTISVFAFYVKVSNSVNKFVIQSDSKTLSSKLHV